MKSITYSTKSIRKCSYCGWEGFGEWHDYEYKIECSNAINCKAWVRVYANTRKAAIEVWNKAMQK